MKEKRKLASFDIVGFLFGVNFRKIIESENLTVEEGWSMVYSYEDSMENDIVSLMQMCVRANEGLKTIYGF